jgi:hypothetical protein
MDKLVIEPVEFTKDSVKCRIVSQPGIARKFNPVDKTDMYFSKNFLNLL